MIALPINIEDDKSYLPKLQDNFRVFQEEINSGLDASDFNLVKSICMKIEKIVILYYSSDLLKSSELIDEIIKLVRDKVPDSISSIYKIYKASDYEHQQYNPMFYKARIGRPIKPYSAADMLHIPFEKRDVIKTQRFSISGTPCIYLGKTSYVCWLEMGRPLYNEFYVSAAQLDDSLTLLNLAYTNKELLENAIKNKDREILLKYCIVYPLIIATSFVVEIDQADDQKRSFKSEYIVSQLITQALVRLKIDGIAYYSKKMSDSNTIDPITLCLAFPAKYSLGENSTSDSPKYQFGSSYNYEEFLVIPQDAFGVAPFHNLNSGLSLFSNFSIHYDMTDFYRFDIILKKYFK